MKTLQPLFEMPLGWFLVKNGEATTCPPFGVVKINSIDPSTGLPIIGKPSANEMTGVFFNGPAAIPGGRTGQVNGTLPAIAAYQADNPTASDPAHDETWGTEAGSWHLHKGKAGFQIVGAGGYGLCNVIRTDVALSEAWFLAKLTCRNYVAGVWQFAYEEYEVTSRAAAPTLKADGRKGYLAAFATVSRLVEGTVSTAEVQSVVICSQPLTSGAWGLSAATGLAYDIDDTTLSAALTSALGTTVTATGSMTDGWTLTWASDGVRTLLVADVSGLLPSDSLNPATEINNQPTKVGLLVWMRKGFQGDPDSDSSFLFAKPETECGQEDTSGYDRDENQFLSHDSSGCKVWVSASDQECPPP